MKPVIEVGDADFFNKVSTRHFPSFRNRRHIVLRAEEQPILTRRMGLVRDEHWKHLRTLIGPTMFTTGQLKRVRYLSYLNQCCILVLKVGLAEVMR